MNYFHYEIKYWPGARNQVADALSHRPDYRDEEMGLQTMTYDTQEKEVEAHEWEVDL